MLIVQGEKDFPEITMVLVKQPIRHAALGV